MPHQQIPADATTNKIGDIKYENGKKYIWAYTTAGATAATPYKLSYGGVTGTDPIVVAHADTATRHRVVVPPVTVAATSYGWFQMTGECTLTVPSATYTATHCLKIHDGVVTSLGATIAYADTEFAVVVVGGTTVTSITVYLMDRECLGTT